VGILIIGSLYWEDDRQEWRDTRLRMRDAVDVRAPIRYGRISKGRGNTYTMVFSRDCAPGQAKAVPCQAGVQTAEDLVLEAEYLWAAERRASRNGRISTDWGCVTLLPNPDSNIPADILNCWAARVHCAKDYGNVRQTPGEGVLVDGRGMLQIPWPTLVADNSPVALDLLLATATQPDLTGDPQQYPTPQAIADKWRNDTENNVRYFRNNVRDGIHTFEDDAIAAVLDAPREGSSPRGRDAERLGESRKTGE
jgi:hypothetical protein